MKGKIKDINWKKGMVSVKTETEGYSIFEILTDKNLHLGDEMNWDEVHPLGHSKIINLTTNEEFEVYFQNHWVKPEDLRRLLLF